MDDLFKGVCPVINIPFLENCDLDLEGVARIVDYVVSAGCQNISVFAFNSEPHKMTCKEKEQVIKVFLDCVAKRANTLVGIVEYSLRGAIELASLASKGGADGVILFPPVPVIPSERQLLQYFKTIASDLSCPVVIQDAPRTTGVTMSTEFLLRTHNEIENFKFLKVECPLPVLKIADLTRQTNHGLKCLSGNGGIYTIDAFNRGAWGVMPGIGVIEYFVKMYEFFSTGKEEKSRDLFQNLMPLLWFEDQSLEFFIACEKEILKLKGVINSSYVRDPGFRMDEETFAELNTLYQRLNPAFLKT